MLNNIDKTEVTDEMVRLFEQDLWEDGLDRPDAGRALERLFTWLNVTRAGAGHCSCCEFDAGPSREETLAYLADLAGDSDE